MDCALANCPANFSPTALSAVDRRDRNFLVAVLTSLLIHGIGLGWLPGLTSPLSTVTPRLVIQLPSPLAQAEPDLALPTRVVPPAPKAVRHESNFPLHGNLPIMANSATQAREDAPTVSSFHQSIVTADETPPTNRPAETLPAKRPVADILSAYGQELAAAVNTHKRYPRIALLRQLQGSVVLQLEFGVEGRLSGVRVLSSSGYEILDKQALEMVREATPLPQLPAALAGRSLTADIPVVFRISS